MYISPDRAAGGNPVVPEGNVRFRGSLSVVFKTPEMHISPWYWFRREFPVFIRQHLRFTRNFSIGLRYTANQGKLTTITLARYNGPHGETSIAPDGHYALPHIHYITADEIAKGHTHPQENHREVTDRYETLEEALRVFFRDTATLNYEGFFPDLLQGRLFSGY